VSKKRKARTGGPNRPKSIQTCPGSLLKKGDQKTGGSQSTEKVKPCQPKRKSSTDEGRAREVGKTVKMNLLRSEKRRSFRAFSLSLEAAGLGFSDNRQRVQRAGLVKKAES